MRSSYLELLKLAAPETIVVLTALVVLAADLLALRETGTALPAASSAAMIACVGCARRRSPGCSRLPANTRTSADGMLVVDPLTQFVKIALLVLTIFTVLHLGGHRISPRTSANISR